MKLNQVKKGDLIKLKLDGALALVHEKKGKNVFLKPPFSLGNVIRFNGCVTYKIKDYSYDKTRNLTSYCKANKKDLKDFIEMLDKEKTVAESYLQKI